MAIENVNSSDIISKQSDIIYVLKKWRNKSQSAFIITTNGASPPFILLINVLKLSGLLN